MLGWFKKKKSDEIIMSEMSDTATENAIMAAARINGITKISFASHNYMVRDICYFVQKLDSAGKKIFTVEVISIGKRICYFGGFVVALGIKIFLYRALQGIQANDNTEYPGKQKRCDGRDSYLKGQASIEKEDSK